MRAVDGVSFDVRKGEIFGLIGESGCGKTTTGKLVMKLLEPTSGDDRVRGHGRHPASTKDALAAYRRKVQMIFQDPYASMNPRFKIRDVLEEPLLVHGVGASRQEREDLVAQALAAVKLTPVADFMGRFPHMLSGGQRQRAATARTLILSPDLLVADEPVSMIDLSTRAEILAMMKELQRQFGLTLPLHHARPVHGALLHRPDRGDVPRPHRRDRLARRRGRPPRPPLHPGPDPRGLRAGVGAGGRIKELPIKGEIPSAADIPPGLPVPPPVRLRDEGVLGAGRAGAREVGEGHQAACRRWTEI